MAGRGYDRVWRGDELIQAGQTGGEDDTLFTHYWGVLAGI